MNPTPVRKISSAGKGDKPRPVDGKTYRENFDAINWRKSVICPSCGWEIDPDTCHCGSEISKHTGYDGHSPIPAGCTCGYADADKRKNPDRKLPYDHRGWEPK